MTELSGRKERKKEEEEKKDENRRRRRFLFFRGKTNKRTNFSLQKGRKKSKISFAASRKSVISPQAKREREKEI